MRLPGSFYFGRRSFPTPLFTNCVLYAFFIIEPRLHHTRAHHLVVEARHARIGQRADTELRRVAGIDNAVLLHRRDRIGEQRVGHLRIIPLDARVRRSVVAVEIIHPADDARIDEALHQRRVLLHKIAPCLDQRRIAVEPLVRQQEQLRLELRLLLDREGLGGDVALHRALLVGEERLRIERVGLHLLFAEAEIALHPLEVAGDAFLGDEQRQFLQVVELLDALIGMRNQDLRLLLEDRRDRDCRNVLQRRVERLKRVRAHVELDPSRDQRKAMVRVRPARQDRHIEAVLLVCAVHQRLIEAAVLALRHPIGRERHLVERLRLGAPYNQKQGGRRHGLPDIQSHPRLLHTGPDNK